MHRRESAYLPARLFKRLALGGFFALAVLYACSDSTDVASPGHGAHAARVGFAPRYAYMGGSSFMGDPINRIRLTAVNQANNAVVGTLIQDVNPDDQNWNLGLDITLDGEIQVVVTIELINVTNGVESIQWSGVSAPIDVTPLQPAQPTAPITLYQGPPANLTVRSIDISPDSMVLLEAGSAQFAANIDGPSGAHAVWSSANTAIVGIDQNGNISGVRPGSTMVYAVAGPKVDSARVRITQRVTAVSVTPDTQRVNSVGTEVVYAAHVLDARGADVSGATVNWSVEDANVADNIGNGHFRSKASGATRIFATSAGSPTIRGTGVLVVSQIPARVDVTPASAALTAVGAHQNFSAIVRDANGNVVNTRVRWRSAALAVATVDSNGVTTAVSTGSTTITAVAGNAPDTVTGSATLDVTQAVSSLEVTPHSQSASAVGDTLPFTAIARDANNNVIAGIHPVWSSSNPAVATVDSNGVSVARAPGATEIGARIGSMRAFGSLNVNQTVTGVAVTPPTGTFDAIGRTTQASANATDARHHSIADHRATWSSNNTAVVTVDSTGLVTSRGNGNATVTATVDGVNGSATFTVQQLVVTAAVAPSRDSVNVADSVAFNATARDGNAVIVPGVLFTWTSSDTTIATVSNTGMAHGRRAGTVTIRATSGTAFAEAQLIVRPTGSNIHAESFTVAPGSVFEDSTALFTLKARNNGFGASLPSHVRVQGFDAATHAVLLDTVLAVPALASGDSFVVNSPIQPHFNAPVDSAFVRATFDVANEVIELDETDNTVQSNTLRIRYQVATLNLTPDTLRITSSQGSAPVAVQLFDRFGRGLTGRPVSFSIADTSIAVLDPGNVVRANRAGTTFVFARSGNAHDSTLVVVTQQIVSVRVTPDTVRLNAVGYQTHLTAQAYDASHALIPAVHFVWTSLDPGVATVDSTGQVQTHGTGTAHIVATAGSSGEAVVLVQQLAAAMAVLPADVTVDAGQAVPVHATVSDSAGSTMPGAHVTWASADSTIATVDSVGVIAGVRGGSTLVTAHFGALEAHTNVTVNAPNLAFDSVTVAPNPVVEGLPAAVMGYAHNNGAALAGPSLVKVRLRNAADNTVLGGVTIPLGAVAAHTAVLVPFALSDTTLLLPDSVKAEITLDAQDSVHESREDDNVVTTVAIPVRLRVASQTLPARIELRSVGATQQIRDTLRDHFGRVLTRSIHYASSNSAVVTVDTSGLVTAMAFDSAYIVVVADNVVPRTDSIRVVVIRPTVAQLQSLVAGTTEAVVDHEVADSVRATDADGHPVPDADVTWTTSDGTVSASTANSLVSGLGGQPFLAPITSRTDANGVARVHWKLGTHAGNQTMTACIGTHCVSFNTHGRADRPVKGARNASADSQTVTVARIAPNALQLTVTDQFDNPTENARVRWTVDGGFLTTDSTNTDANGVAIVSWTLPRVAGRYVVHYDIKDSVGVFVDSGSFKAVAKPDKPTHHTKLHDDQTVTVAQIAPNAIELMVADSFGNPVEGAIVQYSLHAGHVAGSLSQSADTTDATGHAGVSWNVGTKAGVVLVDYVVTQDGTPYATGSFTAHARAGKAKAASKKAEADNQIVTVARIAPNALELTVTDTFGNPTRGSVDWTLGGAGHGSVSASTTVIDSLTGKATVTWQMPTSKGSFSVNYTVNDELGSPVATGTFHATAKPDSPTHHTKGTGSDNQVVTVAQIAPNALQLAVADSFGNAVEGAIVTYALHAGHVAGSLSQTADTTDTNGISSVSWNVGTKAGTVQVDYAVTQNGTTYATGTFIARARAAKAKAASKRAESDNQIVTVAQTAPNALELMVTDTFGNPTRGSVDWTLGGTGHGSVSASSSVIDSLTGKATVTWQMPTSKGSFSVNYTVNDEFGSPVATGTFHATAKPDNPTHHTKAAGSDNQVVTVAQTAPNALQLAVSDSFGNAVEGAIVTYALHAGHVAGSLSQTADTTDTNGISSVSWNVGTKAGAVQVDYDVAFNGTSFGGGTFVATAKPGPRTRVAGTQDSTFVNKLEHSFGLSGKTFDHYGNERSGDTITFSTTSSLVQVTPSGNVVTKGNGKARITLTSGTDTSSVLVHIAQKATSVTILGKSTQGTDTITALQFGKRMTHRQADGNGQAINDSSYLSSTGWVSRNPAILTVTQTADSVYVTSVSNGTAVVVDSLLDNPTVKDSVIIIVQQHVATSNAITITETASGGPMYTSIIAGSSYHVRANGIDAKGNRVTAFTWTSSDTTVLKVTPFANSDSANIQTVGTHTGTATITVKDRGNKSASVTITVTSSNTGSVQQTSGQTRVAAAGTNPPWIERSALTSRRESGLAVT